MVTPGLLPEADQRRTSLLPWILILLGVFFAGLLAGVAFLIVRLRDERDRAHARVDQLLAELRKPVPVPVPAPPPPVAPAPAPPPPEPPRAPDVRVVSPPEEVQGRLRLGVEEFRAGRLDPAELHFFRAGSDGIRYLLLTSLARGDYAESFSFLSRALAADPFWFRRLAPRELFGGELGGVLAALEARVRENPLDARAKILLAYLYYHEKGPTYAKALLVEASAAAPDSAEARSFLDHLEK